MGRQIVRHAEPIPSRTRAPTSSSHLRRPESARLSCRDAVPVNSHAMFESCSIVTATFAHGDRSIELLAFADPAMKIREVSVGHGIAADQIGRFSRTPTLNSPVLFPLRS